ncbi:MAG: MFS transporter [Deltaproteobacteria bacterium]|nr:MFS transporter [Deltaproteobacteria bacterium]
MLLQAAFTAFLDLVGFSIIFPLFPKMLDHYLVLEGPDSALGALIAQLRAFAGSGESSRFMVNALFGGVLGSFYSIAQFLFSPVWGSLSDRIGRRPTLLLTLTGTAVAHLGWMFAGSFGVLVGARLLGGVMAGNVSTVTAVAADVSEKEHRARAMGVIGASIGLGFIIGPAIGGISFAFNPVELWPHLAAYGINPFSGAAFVSSMLALVNLGVVAVAFPETLPKAKRDATSERTANPLALFSGAIPGAARVNLIYLVFQTAFSAMEFSLVFLTVERFDYAPMDNAMMFVFVGFIGALVQGGLMRRLATRFRETRLAITGMACVLLGMVGVAFASGGPSLYGALFLLAVGSALVMPSLSGLASRYAPESQQGRTLGLFRSAGALSRAIGPVLGGTIYWQLGSASPTLAGAIVILVPITLAFKLPEP